MHTPKQFVDSVVLGIPPAEKSLVKYDTEDSVPHKFLIDLLNGKLLDKDILDHNSDIRPVVDDDTNLKRSIVVKVVVDWILQQYFYGQKSHLNHKIGNNEGQVDFHKDMNHFKNAFLSSINAKPTRSRMNYRKHG